MPYDWKLLYRRRRRTPDPYRVMYFDMETLRAAALLNWDDPTGTRDGTITGATISPTGVPAKSCFFDGNDYISIGAFGLSGTALTFATWVRCSLNPTVSQTLIGDAAESAAIGYIVSLRNANTDTLRWDYAYGTDHGSATASGFFTGYNDAWVHVAVVCDYAAKTCKFYRNGTLHTTVNMTGTPVFPSTSRTRYLGAYNSTPIHPLTNGYIDEVQLWTRALTDAEVLDEARKLPARG